MKSYIPSLPNPQCEEEKGNHHNVVKQCPFHLANLNKNSSNKVAGAVVGDALQLLFHHQCIDLPARQILSAVPILN